MMATTISANVNLVFDNSTSLTKDDANLVNVIIPILYSLICVIGVLGNSLVLYIMTKMTSSMSVTDLYVTNLAVADILLLIMLPFYSIELAFDEWYFGQILCKMTSCLTYISLHASIYFLALMSFDRWLAVVKAVKSRLLRNLRNAKFCCAAIWLFVALPFVILPAIHRNIKVIDGKTICKWDKSNGYYEIFLLTRMIGGFIIPLSIITFCYIHIVCFMKKQRIRMKKTKKGPEQTKLIGMIFIVITFFLICCLPNQITTTLHFFGALEPKCQKNSSPISYTENISDVTSSNLSTSSYSLTTSNYILKSPPTAKVISSPKIQEMSEDNCRNNAFLIHIITVCLAFSNSMLNPIIYSFMSARFRDKIFIIFHIKKKGQLENCTYITSVRKPIAAGLKQEAATSKYSLEKQKNLNKTREKDCKNLKGIFPDFLDTEIVSTKDKEVRQNCLALVVKEKVETENKAEKMYF